MCYYNIGVGINQALFRLGGLREKLAQIAGVLEAILEDDMGDLVWPGTLTSRPLKYAHVS